MSKSAATNDMIQAIPSAGAIVIWLLAIPVEKWAAFAGLVFILLQALYMLWRWRRDIIRERARVAAEDEDTGRGGL